jgi:hypothetical protein
MPKTSLSLGRFRRVAAVLCALGAAACGSSGGETTTPITPSPVLTTVTVSLASASLQVGQTTTATATGTDQNGAGISTGVITWSSSNTNVATVNSSGAVTAVGPGTASITATANGKSGSATVTVTAPTQAGVASVAVTPATASILVGATVQLAATVKDAGGNTLTGRTVDWSSSDPTTATVTPTGLVTGIKAGTATIIATSETRTASSVVTVGPTTPPPACTPSTAIQMSPGAIRTLSSAEIATLCLGWLGTASEYVLIPFNNSNTASSTTSIELASTNTVAVTASTSVAPTGDLAIDAATRALLAGRELEVQFRQRERNDIGNLSTRARISRTPGSSTLPSRMLTGVPASPTVGSIYQLNANLKGNTCTDPKVLHAARVVAVTAKTIVFIDQTSPANGYTDAELAAFGAAFDTLVFALDTTNFGAPTDIDSNGRVGIFFTPGINQLTDPSQSGTIGGLFAGRDLFPANATNGCIGSNEGEMFYMPVPDPNNTINSSYTSKANVSRLVIGTLAHEFQHLINGGRRVYVNNASAFEQVWLNEGLSHIAEELLYYRASGNAPRQNIDLARVRSSQTQLDAMNNYQIQNLARLSSYLQAPNSNSPYSLIDGLEMRGAIWELLRYSADMKALPNERSIWYSLVNSTTNGQANYNAVFGDIVTNTRNWAVAQFADDLGFSVPVQYTYPSWNFRDLFRGIGSGTFPLKTIPLIAGTNTSFAVVGGSAAYVRFRINASVAATVAATSQGQSVPPNMDFILMRTQ